MTTIKDVAKKAGVSISTVSNVLNGTKIVSEPLKKNVLQAVKDLDYSVNPYARGIKATNSYMIGVILTSIESMFFPQVIKGIASVTDKTPYTYQFFNTDYSFEKEERYLHHMLRSRLDGLIINTVADKGQDEYIRRLASLRFGKKKIPVVSLEQDLSAYGVDSVGINNEGGACMATEHLAAKGCRQIVHIAGPAALSWNRDRQRGYLSVVEAMGQKPIIVQGDFTASGGYRCVHDLLVRGIVFDGVFAANDQMAVGAIKALKEFGILVPEQVKVIGFDNTIVSSLITPSLSTIHVPQVGIGQKATEILVQRLSSETEEKPCLHELPIRLIERRSTNSSCPDNWELTFG